MSAALRPANAAAPADACADKSAATPALMTAPADTAGPPAKTAPAKAGPVRRPLLFLALLTLGVLALFLWWYPPWGVWPTDTAGAHFAAMAAVPQGRIDLNTADLTALCSLPGIGETRARAILDWRAANGPFTSLQQLLQVEGIGEKILAGIEPLLWVAPQDEA